jgi:hypothetical protein
MSPASLSTSTTPQKRGNMAKHNLGEGVLFVEVNWEQTIPAIISLILHILTFFNIKPKRKPSLRRKRLAILYGAVTDELTQRPVDGIIVTCKSSKGIYSAVTTAKGLYSIKNIPWGRMDLMDTKVR